MWKLSYINYQGKMADAFICVFCSVINTVNENCQMFLKQALQKIITIVSYYKIISVGVKTMTNISTKCHSKLSLIRVLEYYHYILFTIEHTIYCKECAKEPSNTIMI